MIQLTRLNNHPLTVNSDLIKFVENAPDTVLTLVTGEKIVVLETTQQVLEKIVEFRRTILSSRTTKDQSKPAQKAPPKIPKIYDIVSAIIKNTPLDTPVPRAETIHTPFQI